MTIGRTFGVGACSWLMFLKEAGRLVWVEGECWGSG